MIDITEGTVPIYIIVYSENVLILCSNGSYMLCILTVAVDSGGVITPVE